jgi:RNA polymerase sigma factor (sigma-70 family)
MVEQPLNIDYSEWEKIIINLTAFAQMQIKTYKWANNLLPKGYTVEDFVMETIMTFLENPKQYEPEKSKLTYYLKTCILRRLISNASKSKDNTARITIEFNPSDEDSNLENYFPIFDNTIEDDIDEKNILSEIENMVKSDTEIEEIYFSLQLGLKRREACEELQISPNEYTNRLKRLKRKIDKLIEEFQTIKN